MVWVQFSSVTQSCLTLSDPMNCSTPGLPVHHQLLESTQTHVLTHVHWVSDAIYPSHPLSSPSPPALNLSQHRGLFIWVSSSHQVAKVLEFNFSFSPSNEHPGLISFRMDWLDLLAAQGTLKSLLQHHSSKASILRCSTFFIVQLSHPYMGYYSLFSSSTHWRTSELFSSLSIMHNAATNICVQVLCEYKLLFFWGPCPGVQLVCHLGVAYLVFFLQTANCFLKLLYHLTFMGNVWVMWFLFVLTSVWLSLYVLATLICSTDISFKFSFAFFKWLMILNIFWCVCHPYILFEEIPFHVYCPFSFLKLINFFFLSFQIMKGW